MLAQTDPVALLPITHHIAPSEGLEEAVDSESAKDIVRQPSLAGFTIYSFSHIPSLVAWIPFLWKYCMRRLFIFSRDFVEWHAPGVSKWPFSKKYPFLKEGKAIWATVLFSTGAPWWYNEIAQAVKLQDLVPESAVNLPIADIYFWGFILFAFAGFSGGIYLAWRTIRSMEMKKLLHSIAHISRDEQTNALAGLARGELPKIQHVSNSLCENFKKLFCALIPLPSGDISVAIRLLQGNEYITVGRSSGFSVERERTSEPLSYDDGLAKVLRKEETNRGVFIINEIDKAAEAGVYTKQENDTRYRDYKTMVVAPLNGWDGQRQTMIGILFVTANKSKVFSEKHVDSVAFAADILANLYATIVNCKKGTP